MSQPINKKSLTIAIGIAVAIIIAISLTTGFDLFTLNTTNETPKPDLNLSQIVLKKFVVFIEYLNP